MNTIIFKWNPAFSSYSMFRNLQGIIQANLDGQMLMKWSAWEWQQMRPGDRWYMVKVGYGATGIVATGTLIGKPYRGDDWSGKGRDVHYVDMEVEMYLNPDALPILTSAVLTSRVPEFDWDRGHSGAVLAPEVATKLNALWDAFVAEHHDLLSEKADTPVEYNDKIFWNK